MTRGGLKVRLRVGSNLGLVGAETDWTEPDRFGPTRCGPVFRFRVRSAFRYTAIFLLPVEHPSLDTTAEGPRDVITGCAVAPALCQRRLSLSMGDANFRPPTE